MGLYDRFLRVDPDRPQRSSAWVAANLPPWTTLFGWTWSVMRIQHIRLVHFLLMFSFIAFAVHHVYSARAVDLEERNGELSSIVTGWKLDYRQEDDF